MATRPWRRLRNRAPGVAHSIYLADLTRLAEMKRVVAEIADREQRIDVLINNAGGLFARRRLTEDGLEVHIRAQHMGYFVLTQGLRERLLASRPARIINTASAAHQDATLDFDDLRSAKNYRALKAYVRSKLCNILFTREVARRLHGTGVTANCLHPGFVAKRFVRIRTGKSLMANASAETGNIAAQECRDVFQDRFAQPGVINILDPDVIVLGGGLSNIMQLYVALPALVGIPVFSDSVDRPSCAQHAVSRVECVEQHGFGQTFCRTAPLEYPPCPAPIVASRSYRFCHGLPSLSAPALTRWQALRRALQRPW